MGAQLDCEQIYGKVLGADDEETLDAAMRALTVDGLNDQKFLRGCTLQTRRPCALRPWNALARS